VKQKAIFNLQLSVFNELTMIIDQ